MSSFTSRSLGLALAGLVSLSACNKQGSSSASPESAAAGGPPTTVLPATFAGNIDAPNVIAECDLQNKIPYWLHEYAPEASPGAEAESGRVLQLEIVGLLGYGGGLYSGPKQITVQGSLTENGEVVGSFKSRRTTTGGAFGGYKGTCSLLGRTAKAVAKDISGWLRAPTLDARLGEL